MRSFLVYGSVTGTTVVRVEAEDEDQARDLAVDKFDVHLCHQCSKKIQEPDVEVAEVEED